MNHFSLFTGIGGIDLAAEWAGFETVGQCEFADYQTKVLEKHWPNVPRWRDIRDVTAESVKAKGITNVTLLSGGFPCQPFSTAGKRRSKEDDRYLWPEMLRVIQELRPTWALGENVAGIINLALDTVLSDLEALKYTVRPFNIPACGVNAPHRRARIFIVAHNNSVRCNLREFKGQGVQRGQQARNEVDSSREVLAYTNDSGYLHRSIEKQSTETREYALGELISSSTDVAYSDSKGLSKQHEPRNDRAPAEGVLQGSKSQRVYATPGWKQWEIEPDVGRVADGVPNRVDRIKCLGNAVVPQQVYPILKYIAKIEGDLIG